MKTLQDQIFISGISKDASTYSFWKKINVQKSFQNVNPGDLYNSLKSETDPAKAEAIVKQLKDYDAKSKDDDNYPPLNSAAKTVIRRFDSKGIESVMQRFGTAGGGNPSRQNNSVGNGSTPASRNQARGGERIEDRSWYKKWLDKSTEGDVQQGLRNALEYYKDTYGEEEGTRRFRRDEQIGQLEAASINYDATDLQSFRSERVGFEQAAASRDVALTQLESNLEQLASSPSSKSAENYSSDLNKRIMDGLISSDPMGKIEQAGLLNLLMTNREKIYEASTDQGEKIDRAFRQFVAGDRAIAMTFHNDNVHAIDSDGNYVSVQNNYKDGKFYFDDGKVVPGNKLFVPFGLIGESEPMGFISAANHKSMTKDLYYPHIKSIYDTFGTFFDMAGDKLKEETKTLVMFHIRDGSWIKAIAALVADYFDLDDKYLPSEKQESGWSRIWNASNATSKDRELVSTESFLNQVTNFAKSEKSFSFSELSQLKSTIEKLPRGLKEEFSDEIEEINGAYITASKMIESSKQIADSTENGKEKPTVLTEADETISLSRLPNLSSTLSI